MGVPEEPRPQAPPGWYPVPPGQGPFERLWNGYEWTDRVRPVPMRQSQPLSPAARGIGWAIAGCGALTVLAAMMPWATVGPFSASGTSGDGSFTLFLGIVAVVFGLLRSLSTRASGWQTAGPIICLIAGALVTVVGLADVGSVSEKATVGSGLVLTVLAGLGMAGTSIAGLAKRA